MHVVAGVKAEGFLQGVQASVDQRLPLCLGTLLFAEVEKANAKVMPQRGTVRNNFQGPSVAPENENSVVTVSWLWSLNRFEQKIGIQFFAIKRLSCLDKS